MDNNDRKSYGNDNYNYKSKYSYKKDSINLNKIKCINDNISVNGNNAGNVNVGNKGEGYQGANSYGSGYYDGYGNNKQGKNLDCVINNNNNNTNIAISEGNQTIPPEPATLTVKKQVFGCDNIITFPLTSLSCNVSIYKIILHHHGLIAMMILSLVAQNSVYHYQRVFLISRYWTTKILKFNNFKAQNKEQLLRI
jgi:hypothetical protein